MTSNLQQENLASFNSLELAYDTEEMKLGKSHVNLRDAEKLEGSSYKRPGTAKASFDVPEGMFVIKRTPPPQPQPPQASPQLQTPPQKVCWSTNRHKM